MCDRVNKSNVELRTAPYDHPVWAKLDWDCATEFAAIVFFLSWSQIIFVSLYLVICSFFEYIAP